MTNAKELWLDVDGVLLDWCKPFIQAHHKHHLLEYDDIADYAFSNFYSESGWFAADIKTFNKSDAYRNLPPLARYEDLEQLVRAGYTLNVITQICEDDPAVKEARLENLEHNFSSLISEVHFTYKGEDKLQKLLQLRPNGRIIVVEDNPAFLFNADYFVRNSLQTDSKTRLFVFGVLHPYNREIIGYKYIVPVEGMTQVTKMILALENIPYVE